MPQSHHSGARSEPRLRPMPQLVAMPDPLPTGKARDQTHILMAISQVLNPLSQKENSL